MVIISLILLWPLLLMVGALYLLGMALPVIAACLLVWNLILLLILLLIFRFWKKRGTMDRAYIDTLEGGKRVLYRVLRVVLLLVIIWVAIQAAACLIYLIVRPDIMAILAGLLG